MLGRLARRLRAAGHDVWLAEPGMDDAEILRRCLRENRWLITCDREIARRRNARRVIVLHHGPLEELARQLSERLDVDWLHAPFSRCLVCNSLLANGPGDDAGLPDWVLEEGHPVRHCPRCRRNYWPGGHVQRTMERLRQWQRRFGGAGRLRGLGSGTNAEED